MEKFALRAFNCLQADQEISGPQAASYLLGLPDYYTLLTTIRHLNLGQLRHHFEFIIAAEPDTLLAEEESARVTGARKAPRNLFDHYRWRGPSFSAFSLYEYCKLVTVKPLASSSTSDIPFLSEHPDHEHLLQNYSGRKAANTYMVALISSLSENQDLEDSVHGGHPETESMQNDLALILLALLVPWEQLPHRFAMFDCSNEVYKGHCATIWNEIMPSLPPHVQIITWNIQLLRKSKEDVQVNAILQKEA